MGTKKSKFSDQELKYMAECIDHVVAGNWGFGEGYLSDEEWNRRKSSLSTNYARKKKRGVFDKEKAKEGVHNLLTTPIARKLQSKCKNNRNDSMYDGLCEIPEEARKMATEMIFEDVMEESDWELKEMKKKTKK